MAMIGDGTGTPVPATKRGLAQLLALIGAPNVRHRPVKEPHVNQHHPASTGGNAIAPAEHQPVMYRPTKVTRRS